LASLPKTFADLTALTVLDLSHNSLTALPDNFFALPELTTLNLSHNLLPGLPFNSPFASSDGRSRPNRYTSDIFFTPAVARASSSLPRLVVLDVSYNQISAIAIDETIPISLTKIDLSGNPLGPSQSLLRNLASLKRLKELKLEKSEIGNDSFPPTLFSDAPFPNLRLLDVSDTQVTLEPVKGALKLLKQELDFDFITEDTPDGVVRVLVGKRIIKEPWELELERRAKARGTNTTSFNDDWAAPAPPKSLSDQASVTNPTPISKTATEPAVDMIKIQNKPSTKVVKEAWEIEAEQGLLTEGGKRRARAAAAAAAQSPNSANIGLGMPSTINSSSPPPLSPGSGLSNSQYFTSSTQTLRLPPSAPLAKSAGHSRAFSLATPTTSALSLGGGFRTGDISVPAPTLPLSVITTQPFAQTLRVLILANRRMDRSFALPSSPGSISGFLPCLEELDLEGCNLTDLVTVYPDSTSGRTTPPRSTELILPTLAKLFPSLRTLNLSYNALTNASLTPEALSTLILTSPHRKGLRHLRLGGNKFSELDGFLNLAEAFKGNRNVPEWKLEELDLRDNEIGKLPPELGLLPLDVFLVDGNM
jgi:Leucine-rich repeat (LRR) protein